MEEHGESTNALIVRTVADERDLRAAFAVRLEVFTGDQGINEDEDRDGLDDGADHVLALVRDRPVGTARLVMLDDGRTARIGRMAVLKPYRMRGIGRAIVEKLLAIAVEKGVQTVILGAQEQAAGFYERLGFGATEERYMEVGIPHVTMKRDIKEGAP